MQVYYLIFMSKTLLAVTHQGVDFIYDFKTSTDTEKYKWEFESQNVLG